MKRREFLSRVGMGVGAAWAGSKLEPSAVARATSGVGHCRATDRVTLGRTGIRTSRLACGTGTRGVGKESDQTRGLGMQGLADLLVYGYEHGLRFFDTADSYGTHPAVAMALKHVSRDHVTVLTKSWARTPNQMRADIDRFRKELGTDYIDILLMHCLSASDWTTRYRSVTDVMAEAKAKGVIRAHGCSCHTLGALKAAAATDWVDIQLVRMNPIGSHMDANPEIVKDVVREMRSKTGRGIVGMKILGQGDLTARMDLALQHALQPDLLDAFTIGATSVAQQNDLVARIGALRV